MKKTAILPFGLGKKIKRWFGGKPSSEKVAEVSRPVGQVYSAFVLLTKNIGGQSGFKHVTHIGYDPENGFDVNLP